MSLLMIGEPFALQTQTRNGMGLWTNLSLFSL